MFEAICLLQCQEHSKQTLHKFKHIIADKHKVSSMVTKPFENKFQDGVGHGIDMFEGSLKSLDSPITVKEVETFVRLNNNWACIYNSIPDELLKYAPAELSRFIADMFNEVFEKYLPLEIGTGRVVQFKSLI